MVHQRHGARALLDDDGSLHPRRTDNADRVLEALDDPDDDPDDGDGPVDGVDAPTCGGIYRGRSGPARSERRRPWLEALMSL